MLHQKVWSENVIQKNLYNILTIYYNTFNLICKVGFSLYMFMKIETKMTIKRN